MGAFPYVAYVEMCSLRWNIYYFRNLIVSTVHCHKNLWVGLSKFKCFVNMCYLNLHKCMNWLKTNSLSPKIALLMLVYTCFLFNFSIKLLIRLGLTPLWLINMSLIASSLNLKLFMSYLIDRAKKKRWNNKHMFLKMFTAALGGPSLLPMHLFHVSQLITQRSFVFREQINNPSTGISICQIIRVTMHNRIRNTG